VFAHVHPFGKGLGAQGAIVFGTTRLKEYLVNFARSFVYSTALPLSSLVAIKCAYERMDSSQNERTELQKLVGYYRRVMGGSGMPLAANPEHAIQPIVVGSVEKTLLLSQKLQASGIDIRPILSPTVQKGKECLRLCFHPFNTFQEIDRLITILKENA